MSSLPRLRCLSFLQPKRPSCLSLSQLKQIHCQLLTNALKSPQFHAHLIESYCALSNPQATNLAHLVFSHFHHPNLYLLNVLIRSTTPSDSILLFANSVSKASLGFDDFTYIFVLGACARSEGALWEGKQVHSRIIKHGFSPNIMVQTTAIHFYASNKDVGSARKVFDEMPVRNSVTWNAMIRGYSSQKMKTNGHGRSAIMLFKDMVGVNGAEPTDTTLVCIVSAAAQLGALETGSCIHGFIEKTLYAPEDDIFVGTGLLDMYSKCGCLGSALHIFSRMREKNVLTWTAMATGLAIHGKGKEALELLEAMEAHGVKPNAVTFTSLFLACCHAGLVKEGLCLFHSMEGRFGVEPLIQHYGCIVDLLGRSGHLEEAYKFILRVKGGGDAILWRSLMNACKVHGDVVMGEKVGSILLNLQPKQKKDFLGLDDLSEDYIALSNVYASWGRWKDVEMVRNLMKIKGIEIKPGSSYIR